MSAPPLRPTRTLRRVLKVLLEQDDGELYGLRIARATRTLWRLGVPSGAVTPLLMHLEREGWVTCRWEDLDPDVEAAFPGRWQPRKRFYSLHPDYREHARHFVRSKRDRR